MKAGEPSDPYLMTGFDNKVLHLTHEIDATVEFAVEVDFLGNGTWKRYGSFTRACRGLRSSRVHARFQRPLGAGYGWRATVWQLPISRILDLGRAVANGHQSSATGRRSRAVRSGFDRLRPLQMCRFGG